MDDIDAIIEAAKNMQFEGKGRKPFLNPMSALPASKRALKAATKERIKLLHALYISLATFVPDEDWEAMWYTKEELTDRHRMIIRRVLAEMKKNQKEMRKFKAS